MNPFSTAGARSGQIHFQICLAFNVYFWPGPPDPAVLKVKQTTKIVYHRIRAEIGQNSLTSLTKMAVCTLPRHPRWEGRQEQNKKRPQTGLCSGGVGSPVRPFARPPDRPETCENPRATTKITGKRSKTTESYQNHKKTTKNALARAPVAKRGPVTRRALPGHRGPSTPGPVGHRRGGQSRALPRTTYCPCIN